MGHGETTLWSAFRGTSSFEVTMVVEDLPSNWVSTGNHRVGDHTEYRYGTQVMVSTGGDVGRFNFPTMCTSFTSLLVMMMLARMTADFTMMNLRGDKSHVYKDAKNSLVSKDIAAVELQQRKAKEQDRIRILFDR